MRNERRPFVYTPPTYADAKQLSERKSRGFDGMYVDGVKFFKAKDGDNEIRILPPTWDGASHYSYEVKIHREVGPDRQSYLCLDLNEASPERGRCPVCAERREMQRRRAKQEDLDAIRAQTSEIIMLLDRNKKEEGVMVWGISPRTDNEILSQSLIKRSQTYLPIAHPVDGYDVEFVRQGEGRNTRYRGFKVARSSSPITDNPDLFDEIMDYVQDHPIPDILKFYPSDHIRLVFRGEVERKEEEEVETRQEEDVRDRPRDGESRVQQPEEEPPFEVSNAGEPEQVQGRGNGEVIEARPTRVTINDERPAQPAPAARPAQEAPATSSVSTALQDRLRRRMENR